ncbi:hypothetical protein ACNQ6O_10270 [Marinobacter sp. SBS5]|uniref:hypothetical protein n=1 Tax=Marinobacter sp. SBS5 TaxID=3401754 RepID=UPI003AAEF76F
MAENSRQRRLACLAFTGMALALSGCGGEESGTGAGELSGNRVDEKVTPEVVEPQAGGARKTVYQWQNTRYQFANGCYSLGSDGVYISKVDGGEYGVTTNPAEAASFTMRPTRLGSYLLMSDFTREETQVGQFELLGISDPGGEFLDASGQFIGELSYLVSGLGDTLNLVLDPVAPLGGILRDLGESLDFTGGQLANTDVQPKLAAVNSPNELAVWNLNKHEGTDTYTLASDVTGLLLTATEEGLTLASPSLRDETNTFTLQEAQGCVAYPEADLSLEVVDERGPAIYLKEVDRFKNVKGLDKDDIYGYVDTHSHISAYEFIGGRVNYGDPFHKFGVTHALEDCAIAHGPGGTTGLVETVTSGSGPHDTQGWPSFNDWPRHNSLQHHQSYYRWMERAHLSGMKILVNHLVHNEILCGINPQKQNDCDPMEAILLQIQRMYEMQDYIDAQHGGPGEGWFQIVTSPGQARSVIADGKLAVVLGVEMSKVLNCGEFLDVAECTRQDVVEGLDQLYQLGVRNIFPVHKFDNAFGGHLPDLSSGIGIGPILAVGNLGETGHLVEYEECPEGTEFVGDEPDQNAAMQPFGIIDQLLFQMDYFGDRFPETPEELKEMDPRRGTGHLCNRRGLTDLGDFLIQELVRRKMMIETDHISRKAAARILDITGRLDYPVINSHGGWGGTEALRDRIAEQGGIAASFGGTREGWVDSLVANGNRPRADRFKVGPFGGAGFATDVNGIAALPGNPGSPDDDARLYPFESVDGRVILSKQKTGDREFGLYDGRGIAHYGLYPDQIADMILNADRPKEIVDEAVNQLFTSAEAYLRMWERIENAPL